MDKKKIFVSTLLVFLLISVSTISYLLGTMSARDSGSTSMLSSEENEFPETWVPSPSEKETETTSLSPTISPTLKTEILLSLPNLDGFRGSNNSGNSTQEIKVGRNVNFVSRGFVSFDLSKIPATAKVTEAKLRVYQAKISGNPYTAGKILKVDHLTYGDNLDESDYGMAALSSGFATLSNPSKEIEWKESDVTYAVRNDLSNARSVSQFRLHLQIEITGGTDEGDFIHFEGAENTLGSGKSPELIVLYH